MENNDVLHTNLNIRLINKKNATWTCPCKPSSESTAHSKNSEVSATTEVTHPSFRVHSEISIVLDSFAYCFTCNLFLKRLSFPQEERVVRTRAGGRRRVVIGCGEDAREVSRLIKRVTLISVSKGESIFSILKSIHHAFLMWAGQREGEPCDVRAYNHLCITSYVQKQIITLIVIQLWIRSHLQTLLSVSEDSHEYVFAAGCNSGSPGQLQEDKWV